MPKHLWRISLKPLLSDEQKLESPYGIAKKLGMSKNTVIRYVDSDVEYTDKLSPSVGLLARYFNIDVHKIIELVEAPDNEDNPEGQRKTLLAIA